MACPCPSSMSDFSLNRGFPLGNNNNNNTTSPRHSTPRKPCTMVDTEADTMCLDELFHSTCNYANEVNSRICDRRENEKRAMGDNLSKDLLFTEVTTKSTDYYRGLVQDKLSTRRDILEKTQQDMADSFNHLFSAARQVENSDAYSGLYKELQNLRALVKVVEVAAERYGVSNSESRFLGDLEKVVRCIECINRQYEGALCEISKLRAANTNLWEETRNNLPYPSEDPTQQSPYHEEKPIYTPCDDQQQQQQQQPATYDETLPCSPCGDQPKCEKNPTWTSINQTPTRRPTAGRCDNPLLIHQYIPDPNARRNPCETHTHVQCPNIPKICPCAKQPVKPRQSCESCASCASCGCNFRQCSNCVPCQSCPPCQCKQPTPCSNACMQYPCCQCPSNTYSQLQHICYCKAPCGEGQADTSNTSCEDTAVCPCPPKEEVGQPCLPKSKRRKKGSPKKQKTDVCDEETCARKPQKCKKKSATPKTSDTVCGESSSIKSVDDSGVVGRESPRKEVEIEKGVEAVASEQAVFCPVVQQDVGLQTSRNEGCELPSYRSGGNAMGRQSPCTKEVCGGLLTNKELINCGDRPASPRICDRPASPRTCERPVGVVPTCLPIMTDAEMIHAAQTQRRKKMLRIGLTLLTLALLLMLVNHAWEWKTKPASEDEVKCKTCSPVTNEADWSVWDVLAYLF